jgi:predicted secreted Zn-dependent protease
MVTVGPLDRYGHHVYAVTAWQVKWRYPYVRDKSGCRTGPVKTSVTVTMQLPNWIPVRTDLEQEWNRFSRALREHENGHRDNGLDTASAIAEALAALRPRSSCEQLEVAADAEGARLIQAGRKRDEEYDWKTNHGVTQGARLR